MFRVMLVATEPVTLAGLKTMIDWGDHNCEIVGIEKDGQAALDQLGKIKPDIIITNVEMPNMNGMEFMQHVKAFSASIVFLMLADRQQFENIQEALRLGAIDYLLKKDLDAASLLRAIKKAQREVVNRKKLNNLELLEHYEHISSIQKLRAILSQYFTHPFFSQENGEILESSHVMDVYGVIQLSFHLLKTDTPHTMSKGILKFSNIVQTLAKYHFRSWIFIEGKMPQTKYLIHWGTTSQNHEQSAKEFYTELEKVLDQSNEAIPDVHVTDIFHGISSRAECLEELRMMEACTYMTGRHFVSFREENIQKLDSLLVESTLGRLDTELKNRHFSECMKIMDTMIEHVQKTNHERMQAIWLCNEVYLLLMRFFIDKEGIPRDSNWFTTINDRFSEVQNILFCKDTVEWLQKIKQAMDEGFRALVPSGQKVLEMAKRYVYENIDKKITVAEVATHVGMSANYFSTFFKSHTNQNYIEYIYHVKMKQACELLTDGDQKISVVAKQLGFQSTYYFSKMFRKYIGISPSEYRRNHLGCPSKEAK